MNEKSIKNLNPKAAMKGDRPKVRLSLSIDQEVKAAAKRSGENISELVENFLKNRFVDKTND